MAEFYGLRMPRKRIIPDEQILSHVRALISRSGERAASFGAVSRLTGLAAPTLVQRYGSQDGMVRKALLGGWDLLDQLTDTAAASADLSAKGAQGLLKALGSDAVAAAELAVLVRNLDDPALRDRAADWQSRVENALALRLGGGSKSREAASILFAAWQGQLLWSTVTVRGFKLKDAVKRLT